MLILDILEEISLQLESSTKYLVAESYVIQTYHNNSLSAKSALTLSIHFANTYKNVLQNNQSVVNEVSSLLQNFATALNSENEPKSFQW